MMFDLIFNLFPLFFLLVLGLMIWIVVQNIRTSRQNDRSPKLEVDAIVVTKRTHVSYDNTGTEVRMHTSSTRYYATFQVNSGDRMEFAISGQEYGQLAEGDRGTLHFQGPATWALTAGELWMTQNA